MEVLKAIKSTFYRKKKQTIRKKITLGICAMDRKAQSKPMREILQRLPPELFEIVIFGDDTILNKPIEQWPVVEALISFYSSKFPTDKAINYVKLNKPFMFNDLEMETIMKDRRKVYDLLKSQGIDVPKHVYVERDIPDKVNTIEEYDEYVVINGVHIDKPLVEKPVDAEDHNIHIYYPISAGGGSKRLFRKVHDRSSEFYPHENELRKEGSYIYEEFVYTQGTDVKVYTVGPDYGHAEARKSPVVDGKVNRDSLGFEVRYPVILTQYEKDLARTIVSLFRQTVCGFDILRVKGKSYVCDVNGFSFVKNSRKYYDDASQILIEIMLTTLRPEYQSTLSTRLPLIREVKDRNKKYSSFSSTSGNDLEINGDDRASPIITNSSQDNQSDTSQSSYYNKLNNSEELRCVIAVIRHADRTPKQKMKLKVTLPKYLEYYRSYTNNPYKELKVKSKSALVKFLNITNDIINDNTLTDKSLLKKLKQIKDVLERWEISGFNRKLQMKPQKWVDTTNNSFIDNFVRYSDESNSSNSYEASEILLILKWGGDLTPLGREQSETAGIRFRHELYPDINGGGVLRLHSTYRHDLKIKASDEGRVMKTAAAFTKGLLELEGQLTPILASLVTVEEKNRQMLDRNGNNEAKEHTDRCKSHLNILQQDIPMNDELIQSIAPDGPVTIVHSLKSLDNPLKTLQRIHELINNLCKQLEEYSNDYIDNPSPITSDSINDIKRLTRTPSPLNLSNIVLNEPIRPFDEADDTILPSPRSSKALDQSNDLSVVTDDGLYLSETFELMSERWTKLNKDFYNKTNKMYDLTKVPDVYDMIRYDVLHNSHLKLDGMEELFLLVQKLNNIIVPQEYGVDINDKINIRSKMCMALLDKIKNDLIIARSSRTHDMDFMLDHSHAADLAINSLGRLVRTRLYFTSESHIYTLINVLRYAKDATTPNAFTKEGIDLLESFPEFSYLSQIIIRLFEDRFEEDKFRCEISVSPGTIDNPIENKQGNIAPYVILNKSISYDQLISILSLGIESNPNETNLSNINSTANFTSTVSLDSLAVPKSNNDIPLPIRSRSKSIFGSKKANSVTVVSNPKMEESDIWETTTGFINTIVSIGRKKKSKSKNISNSTSLTHSNNSISNIPTINKNNINFVNDNINNNTNNSNNNEVDDT